MAAIRRRAGAPSVSSSASRIDRAEANRAIGLLDIARTTTASTERGIVRRGARTRGACGVLVQCCFPITITLEVPSNAATPVSIS